MTVDAPGDLPDPLDVAVLERLAREGALGRMLAAWDALPVAAVAEDIALRRVVLAALRLDLALLTRDPSMLFPCLYNRMFWHGDAETAPSATDATDELSLRAWVERWRRERQVRGDAGPWARALRPPDVSLMGPLREEYREDLGYATPRFSADGSAIGVVHADGRVIAWTRATGHRTDAAALVAPGTPFELVRIEPAGSHWGRVRVRDRRTGKITVDLKIDDASSFGVITSLPGEAGLLVAGWWGDYDGVICRIDPPYRAVRWCAHLGEDIHALAVDATGRVVAAAGGPLVHLLDGTSGAALASTSLHAQQLALSPDAATLATGHDDLVRLWDVAALRRARPARVPGRDRGWIAAAFSPDGARLLTGELLCDARDGHLIARLDLDGPGYLEGGPPRHGRRLADGRLVEMAPYGVRVWDTADGRRIVDDTRRRYGLRDATTIAPDGLHYVYGHGHELCELTLRRVDDGQVLAKLGLAMSEAVKFSPDSRRLLTLAGPRLTLWSAPEGVREAVLDHPAPVEGVAVSHDGALAITVADDGVLRLWDLARRELRDTRALPVPPRGHTWQLDSNVLAQAEGWLGFSLRGQRFTTRRRHGLLEIVEGDILQARIVTHDPLIPDPTGIRWASRSEHVALEADG